MARKPEMKRLEILLTPEQYRALHEYVNLEFLAHEPESDPLPNGAMAAAIREILTFAVPAFGDATPVRERGKYQRKN